MNRMKYSNLPVIDMEYPQLYKYFMGIYGVLGTWSVTKVE